MDLVDDLEGLVVFLLRLELLDANQPLSHFLLATLPLQPLRFPPGENGRLALLLLLPQAILLLRPFDLRQPRLGAAVTQVVLGG